MTYTYETNCVNGRLKALQDMIDRSREITYETIARHVGTKELEDTFPYYQWGQGRQPGLRMKDDWAVTYYKSKYRGRKCYYVKHSAIEYIFTE